MKTTIRDIIVNAMDESRLVSRSQPVPGNLFETALQLLKRRLDRYSNTNLLSFTRKEIDFVPTKEQITLGEYELNDDYVEDVNFFFTTTDLPTAELGMMAWDKDCTVGTVVEIENTPTWKLTTYDTREKALAQVKSCFKQTVDIEVDNMQEVVRAYIKGAASTTVEWTEINFVSYEDFYNYENTNLVYSVLPQADTLQTLFVKPMLLNTYKIKLIYNEKFDFNADSELNIPGQYISLFTAGLVYDLAKTYPRMSDTTVALMKENLDELEENVRRSSSVNKFITRDISRAHFSYADFIAGRHLGI